jgi:hypothetical protein
MPCSSISSTLYVVRPGVLSKAIGSLCLWACLSALLVHPKGGRPGATTVVTSYMSVVLGMRDPLDMTMLHGVVGVDSRW